MNGYGDIEKDGAARNQPNPGPVKPLFYAAEVWWCGKYVQVHRFFGSLDGESWVEVHRALHAEDVKALREVISGKSLTGPTGKGGETLPPRWTLEELHEVAKERTEVVMQPILPPGNKAAAKVYMGPDMKWRTAKEIDRSPLRIPEGGVSDD